MSGSSVASSSSVATSSKEDGNCDRVASMSLQVARRDLALDPREDLLGYKIVHWCNTQKGGDVPNVKVLLHLQIPGKGATIYDSEGPSATVPVFPARGNFVDNRKYCTDRVLVTALQFFGPPQNVLEALFNYQQSRGHLLSGYAGGNRFEYDLEALHLEPRAGQPGCGCKHGLHFFRDINAALRHYGHLPGLLPTETPIVAKRLTQGRGLVCDIQSEALAKQNFGAAVAAAPYAAEPLQGPASFEALQRPIFDNAADVKEERKFTRLLSFAKTIMTMHAESASSASTFTAACASTSTTAFASTSSTSSSTSSSVALIKRPLSIGFECPICMEPSTEKHPLQSLQCHARHAFHKECIFGNVLCPMCREPIKFLQE